MHRLKNLLLYADLDPDAYVQAKDEIANSNRSNLKVFSVVACAAMLIMFLQSFQVDTLAKNRMAYGLSALVFLILLGIAFVSKKHPVLVLVGIYSFLAVLFAFGIALGTFIEPNELTVSFVILLFAGPLLFTDVPWRMIIAIALGALLYIPAAYVTQSQLRFNMNMTDVEMYGAVSIIVSSYMMFIKIRRIHLEMENKFLSKWDSLTGLMNRRSFEDDLAILRSIQADQTLFCAFDVNGLKHVNDTIGHAAGDELIQGAASCIQTVFGPYGSCYRTGGDEFIAILGKDAPGAEELTARFQQVTSQWRGKFVDHLSVSVGIVNASQEIGIDDLLSIADKRMYDQKSAYYQQTGTKR